MKISMIIPHRTTTTERNENLLTIVKYYKNLIPDMEIIVVEQDGTKKLDFPVIRYIFTKNTGLFNRSWGLNVGAVNSKNDVLLFTDNDILVGLDAIVECYMFCIKTKGTASTYNTIINLTKEDSIKVRSNLKISNNPQGFPRSGFYAGGMLMMHRDAFQLVGGWDERFRGWGGEDDQMGEKLNKFKVEQFVYGNIPATHLFHEVTSSNTNPNYNHNLQFLTETKQSSIDTIRKLVLEQIKTIGKIPC